MHYIGFEQPSAKMPKKRKWATKTGRKRAKAAAKARTAAKQAALDETHPFHPPQWVTTRGMGTVAKPYTFCITLCELCRQLPTDPPTNKECCPYTKDFCDDLREGGGVCSHHMPTWGGCTVPYDSAPIAVQEWAKDEHRTRREAHIYDDLADDWEGY
jgi:hypothetical protein